MEFDNNIEAIRQQIDNLKIKAQNIDSAMQRACDIDTVCQLSAEFRNSVAETTAMLAQLQSAIIMRTHNYIRTFDV